MNIVDYFNSPVCARFALALVHSLWQGLVVALLAVSVANLFGKNSSRIRYGVYVISLLAMVLSLCATYSLVDVSSPAVVKKHVAETAPIELGPSNDVFEGDLPETTRPSNLPSAESSSAMEAEEVPESTVPAKFQFSLDWQDYTPYLMSLYLLGVITMLGRLLLGLQGGQRLRKLSEPVEDSAILETLTRQAHALGLASIPAVAFCRQVMVPTVVGVFKPTILLPFSFVSGLSPQQVEMLVTHELAHIRRYDPFVNIVQRVIESVLFFHPAVWFISHRIRIERENCCDDVVLRMGGKASEYASSLVEIAQQTLRSASKQRLAAESVSATGQPSRLGNRIRRLMGHSIGQQVRLRHTWVITLAFAAVIGLGAVSYLESNAQDNNGQQMKQWAATLSNGATVELVGICDYPSDGKQWWRPDGSLWSNSLLDGFKLKGGPPKIEPDARLYELAIRRSCDGMRGKVQRYDIRFFPHTDYKTGLAPKKGEQYLNNTEVIVFAFPKTKTSVSLRYSISVTDVKPHYGQYPLEEVEFENISLTPDQKTNVHIKILTPDKTKNVFPAADSVAFEPTLERVLNDCESGKYCFVDLDTGQLFSPSDYIRKTMLRMFERKLGKYRWNWGTEAHQVFTDWAKKNGIDALVDFHNDEDGVLIGIDMLAVEPVNQRIAEEHWRNPVVLGNSLWRLYQSINTQFVRTRYMKVALGDTAVFDFRTAEGGLGIVQAVRSEDQNGKTLKLQYKLLKGFPEPVEPKKPDLWFTILSSREVYESFSEYRHKVREHHSIATRLDASQCTFEIRSATGDQILTSIPIPGHGISAKYLREMGSVPDGLYMVAITRESKRCSNVVSLTIDSNYKAESEPTLKLFALPPQPGWDLPYLGIRAIGPTPKDPKLTNDMIPFPYLVVDGVKRKTRMILWIGPVGPLQSGQEELRILDLNNYTPAIESGRKHTVKAVVGKYESAPVVIPLNNFFGQTWDRTTLAIKPKPPAPPKTVLEGKVIGSDGKEASWYEVHLFGESGKRFSERIGEEGKYKFIGVPAGKYKLV